MFKGERRKDAKRCRMQDASTRLDRFSKSVRSEGNIPDFLYIIASTEIQASSDAVKLKLEVKCHEAKLQRHHG